MEWGDSTLATNLFTLHCTPFSFTQLYSCPRALDLAQYPKPSFPVGLALGGAAWRVPPEPCANLYYGPGDPRTEPRGGPRCLPSIFLHILLGQETVSQSTVLPIYWVVTPEAGMARWLSQQPNSREISLCLLRPLGTNTSELSEPRFTGTGNALQVSYHTISRGSGGKVRNN